MVLPFLTAIAPILGAGISAVGALAAPKPKTGIDLGQLRRDAERNGFNPLTVLRSGAAASYGHVADTRFSNAMQVFGSGVAQFSYDPYGEAKAIAEIRLAEAQIASFAKAGSAPSNLSIGGVPQSAGVVSKTKPADLTGTVGQGTRAFGIDWIPSGLFSSGEHTEAEHGDLMGSIWGFLTVPDQVVNTGLNWAASQPFAPAGDAEHSMNYGWKW